MSKTVLPVIQERSLQTQLRLLKAATEVLDEHGVEGATIPRIAARAKLSAGSVYRRFPDKDALLREVCLRALQGNEKYSETSLKPELFADKSLADIVGVLVKATLDGHLRHRGILRAVLTFTMEHPDTAFVRQLEDLQRKTFRAVSALLLSRRKEIRHPDPESAVTFALLILGMSASGTAVVPRDPKELFREFPGLESQLAPELTRMLVHYLQAR